MTGRGKAADNKQKTSKASRTKWKMESNRATLHCPLYSTLFTLHSLFSTLLYTLPTPLTFPPSALTNAPCQSQCPFPFSFCSARSTRSRRGEWTQGDAVVVVAVAAGVAAAVSVSQLNLRAKNVPLFAGVDFVLATLTEATDRETKREKERERATRALA